MNRATIIKREREKGKLYFFLSYYTGETRVNSKGITEKIRKHQSLNLFTWKEPKDRIKKDHNKQVELIASEILIKKLNELAKADIYNEFEKERLKTKELQEQDFIQYFNMLTKKRKGNNYKSWLSVQNYLNEYFPNGIRFADIDIKSMNDFKEYLLSTKSTRSAKTTLSVNSALSYFNKVKASLKQAYKDGFLQRDINAQIDPIKAQETRREFLTLEELQSLVKTPCNDIVLKKASLFSALTGLRFSDIEKLKGNEVRKDSTGYYLTFTQQKTKGVENHYISKQAYDLLGNFKNDDSQVFEGLKYSAYANKHLAQWIGAAGITKNITFHSFRHTYATLQLDNGTDIYTVSKLLGHKSIKTTQIYTKVLDDRKREAANRINLNFEEE